MVTISSPFPRSIFGGFHIYMAIFGQLHLLVSLLFGLFFKSSRQPYDVFIVDQLSACVPFLRWITGRRVVFYCHFPDKLLAGGKEAAVEETKIKAGLVKSVYRGPADWLEERSTGEVTSSEQRKNCVADWEPCFRILRCATCKFQIHGRSVQTNVPIDTERS